MTRSLRTAIQILLLAAAAAAMARPLVVGTTADALRAACAAPLSRTGCRG